VPDSPPIIPVLVPFFVTSSAVPGAMTGAELEVEVLGAGALVAGGTTVVSVFLSVQPRHNAANKTDEVRVIRNTF
jgi:hypothetical protein